MTRNAIDRLVTAVIVIYLCLLAVFASGILPVVLLPAGGTLALFTAVLLRNKVLTGTAAAVQSPHTETAARIIAVTSVCMLFLLLLQTVYLPPAADILTGRQRAQENHAARTAISSIGAVAGTPTPTWFAFSRNRSGSLRMLLHCLALTAAALLTAILPQRYRHKLLGFLIVIGVILAVLGILHQWILPRPRTIWWIYSTGHGRPVACFPTRAQYGGFLALLTPAALLCSIHAWRQSIYARFMLFATAFTIIFTAVFLSLSRGAVIAAAAGVCAALPAYSWTVRNKVIAPLAFSVIVLSAAAITVTFMIPDRIADPVWERLATISEPTETSSARLRFGAWGDALRIWRRYPLAGCGANGFRMLQPVVRRTEGSRSFAHAENQYLQLLAEGGIIGAGLGAIWLAAILAGLLAGLNRRQTAAAADANAMPPEAAVATGVLAAALLHNALDFPLHNPLYAAVTVIMITMAFNASGTVNRRWPAFVLLPLTAYLLAVTAGGLRHSILRRDRDPAVYKAAIDQLPGMLRDAPTSWYSWYMLGARLINEDEGTGSAQLIQAQYCLEHAVKYNRGNALPWQMLGWIKWQRGEAAGARAAYSEMQRIRPWMQVPAAIREPRP